MKNNKTPERIKERNARAIAFQVVLISALVIIFRLPVLMLFLGVDFIIRAFINSKYSPLSLISGNFLASKLPFRNKLIMLKPKKFAASIGAVLSASAGLFGIFDHIFIMISLSGVLFLFSFLETFLKFCAGCHIFSILIKMNIIPEEYCTDCTLDSVG